MPAVMRCMLLVVVACSVTLAGCGGGEEAATPSTPRDLGRDVVGAFVEAAAQGDAETTWNLLSTPSQRRAGPTLAAFNQAPGGVAPATNGNINANVAAPATTGGPGSFER